MSLLIDASLLSNFFGRIRQFVANVSNPSIHHARVARLITQHVSGSSRTSLCPVPTNSKDLIAPNFNIGGIRALAVDSQGTRFLMLAAVVQT